MTTRFDGGGGDLEGFWGPVTSSIDWCEQNYRHSVYIAEFFNTTSNIGLVLAGVLAMIQSVRYKFEFRYIALGFTGMLVGLGSIAFHCTLQYWAQMWDEVPMVWSILVWVYCFIMMDSQGSWPLAIAMSLYGAMWAFVHYQGAFVTAFQVHFGFLVVAGLTIMSGHVSRYCMLPILPVSTKRSSLVDDAHLKLRRMAQLYLFYLLLAFFFWVVDQQACPTLNNLPGNIPNPQLHAWWHVFAGVNTHFGIQFSMTLRQSIVDQALPCTSWRLRGMIGWVSKTPKHLMGTLKRRD